MDEILVGGQQIDDKRGDGICILPFFVQLEYPMSWIFGTIMMHKYYMVYDGTPYQYDKLQYNRIGIAKKNPVDLIGIKEESEANSFLKQMELFIGLIFTVSLSCVVCIIYCYCKNNRKDVDSSIKYKEAQRHASKGSSIYRV